MAWGWLSLTGLCLNMGAVDPMKLLPKMSQNDLEEVESAELMA